MLYANDYYLDDSIYVLGSFTFFTVASKNYKLTRHMNLVEWICDNQKSINEILQETEDKICDGDINLNNISNVSYKYLRKIKKKVLCKNNRG